MESAAEFYNLLQLPILPFFKFEFKISYFLISFAHYTVITQLVEIRCHMNVINMLQRPCNCNTVALM